MFRKHWLAEQEALSKGIAPENVAGCSKLFLPSLKVGRKRKLPLQSLLPISVDRDDYDKLVSMAVATIPFNEQVDLIVEDFLRRALEHTVKITLKGKKK